MLIGNGYINKKETKNIYTISSPFLCILFYLFFTYAFSVNIGTTCFFLETTPFNRAVLFSKVIP